MPFVIDNQLIIGCDQNSRIYCESFNTLCQALPDGAIEISSEQMSELDLSALCIYMGKYVEQEINSSVVQLMRKCCGVSMPDFYCRRDPSLATQCDIVTGNGRVVRLNEQANRKDETSLKTIPLGDSFHAMEVLLQTRPSFFDNYAFINDDKFKFIKGLTKDTAYGFFQEKDGCIVDRHDNADFFLKIQNIPLPQV